MTDPVHLSEEGRARRARILEDAQQAQRWRIRRRRAVQGAGASLVIGLVVTAALRTSAPPTQRPAPVAKVPSAIQVVHTSAATLEQIATPPSTSSIHQIDDQELLDVLRAAGRDVGLVRTQGRVVVLGAQISAPAEEAGRPG